MCIPEFVELGIPKFSMPCTGLAYAMRCLRFGISIVAFCAIVRLHRD